MNSGIILIGILGILLNMSNCQTLKINLKVLNTACDMSSYQTMVISPTGTIYFVSSANDIAVFPYYSAGNQCYRDSSGRVRNVFADPNGLFGYFEGQSNIEMLNWDFESIRNYSPCATISKILCAYNDNNGKLIHYYYNYCRNCPAIIILLDPWILL